MARPSKETEIRDEIARRIRAGEPLTVRAVLHATGGSASTVSRLIREMTAPAQQAPQAEDASHLEAVPSPLLPAVAVEHLIETMRAEVRDEVRSAMTLILDKFQYMYQQLREETEKLASLTRQPESAASLSRGEQSLEIQALQAQINRLSRENATLIQQRERAIRELGEMGVEYEWRLR